VRRGDASKVSKTFVDNVTDRVVFDSYMLHISVMRVVLCEKMCSIVVTVEGSLTCGRMTEAIQQLAEKNELLACVVESNVFSIAG